ncbi:DUF3566 domain-containing protein [Nocardioides panacisoli]|uniref:DUF3566 domain-containing protein n=1 Tax=Nocardioides panacisoli TaxID=627624 RepID=UPI001C633BC5|nr:DUF3566 domain-containing protein [Nocardioides panacisoli]QYJ03271.1 DUF3566 domain-containing protein [Nocardioides panacisoli]
MTDRHTDSRGEVSEETDAEKTKVAGIPRVTEETSTEKSASSGKQQKPEPAKNSDAAKQADSGSEQQDKPAKQSFAAAAKSTLDAAKKAASQVGGERGEKSASPVTQTAPAPKRGPRRARLRLTRIDPWSVMKTAFLLSIAFAVVTVVAVGMVWQVLGAAGVWDSINETVQSGIGGDDISSFQVEDYVGTSRVLGFTMLVAAVDVVLITAAATLSAFLYNMAAALLGGVEVTLSEDVD